MAFVAGTVAKQTAGKAVAKKTAAKAGAKAAGGKAAALRAPAGGPTKLERDRAAVQAIKDAREPEPEPEDTPAPAPTSSGAGAAGSPIVIPAAAATGSGFLFGVFAWALGLAYLRGGGTEVRRFLAAKFFNKVEGS